MIKSNQSDSAFTEYKGVIHVHTSLGGHSTGNFSELISAANENDLDFVLMTEHPSSAYDSSSLTLNGLYGKTLFIGGNEIDTAEDDRFLMIPGSAEADAYHDLSTSAAIDKLHSENRLALSIYPEQCQSCNSGFDGEEVFSLSTNGKKINPVSAVIDMLWSFQSYPAVTMATYFTRPDANLKKYDEIASKRRVTLFAGADAHSNIGFHLFGDDAGHKLINLKVDPYAMIFQLARMHVFIEKSKPLTKENLIEAVKDGHFFTGFDVIGDTDGFSFTAENGDKSAIMGDGIGLSTETKLTAVSPHPSRFVVLKNGEHFYEASMTTEVSVPVTEKAEYRIEVYRDDLGTPFEKMPWIMSNPIYVR